MSGLANTYTRPLSPGPSSSQANQWYRTSNIRTSSEPEDEPEVEPEEEEPRRNFSPGLPTPVSPPLLLPAIPSAGPSSTSPYAPQDERYVNNQLHTPPSDALALPNASTLSLTSDDHEVASSLLHLSNLPRRPEPIRTPPPGAFTLAALEFVTAVDKAKMDAEAAAHPRFSRKTATPPKLVRKARATPSQTAAGPSGRKRKLDADADSAPAQVERPSKSRKVAPAKDTSTKKVRGRASKTVAAKEKAPSSAAAAPKVSKPRNRFVNPRPTERMNLRPRTKAGPSS